MCLQTILEPKFPTTRFETLAYWLLRVPDHVDHEPHIFPYILSGLFDENVDIALETFWLLEACGTAYEVENEKDLREKRQYGLDGDWTYKGLVQVPFPIQAKLRKGFQCDKSLCGSNISKINR